MPAAVSWGAEAADLNKQLGHGLRLSHLILREHILKECQNTFLENTFYILENTFYCVARPCQ